MKISGKLQSELRWDGVLLKKGNDKEFVRIEGDEVEINPEESFKEGLLKFVAVHLTAGSYPLLASVFKAASSYNKVAEAATYDMDEEDKWVVFNSALKGAILGGVKGALHGTLDNMVILGLTAGALAVMGPIGFFISPVISGFYNVLKDSIRK